MKKKVLAWMLSVFMVITMMPLPAFATTTETGEQAEVTQEVTVPEETETDSSAINNGSESNEGIATAAEEDNVNGLSGKGTESDPYLIEDSKDLVLFRDSVNAEEITYNAQGVYVALGADIDLAGIDWSVNIGDDCNATFDGIFDGKGHKISNLTGTETAAKSDGYTCTGLFGVIAGSAVVKNFTIENVNINTGDFVGNNIGAVVGFAYKASGSVENVKVIGDIDIKAAKASSVGTIVGYAYGGNLTVENCTVDGNSGASIIAKSQVGGVIGYAGGKLTAENCTVQDVAISGNGLVGGVAGILCGGSAIDNTVKNVDLTATGDYWKASAAVTVGTISEPSTVAGTTYENVTANGEDITTPVGSEYVNKPTVPVNKVPASVNNVFYTTFDKAIVAIDVVSEATITLYDDVTLDKTFEVKEGKKVTLDLNGKTISQEKACTAHYEMIKNNGSLTIIGNGKISFKDTGAGDPNFGWGSYTITNRGDLVIENGTIENLSAQNPGAGQANVHMYCAIQQSGGKVTINDGKISTPTYRSVRVNKGELVINGGEFVGQVWLQPNQGDASINVTGGTFAPAGNDGSSIFLTNERENYTVSSVDISGGTFTTKIGATDAATLKGTITGGTFKVVNETVNKLLSEDYKLVENEDGTYGAEEIVATKISDTKYPTLQKAIDAAVDGDTIILMADCAEDVTVTQAPDVKITIDGNDKIMSGAITVDGKSAAYATAGLTIKNVEFDASGIAEDASINLGVSGNNNTRYTSNVTVEDCKFTGGNRTKVAIKSYTGGDKNLTVTGCEVDDTMHSLLQATNITGIVIDDCTVNSKNGINLNSSSNVEIKDSTISVSGYAVRAGASSGGESGKIALTNNTLKTDNEEGDAVIVLRGDAVTEVELEMTENVVSGDIHISGTTADTNITANDNYWDGEKAPKVSGAPVEVDSYYKNADKTGRVEIIWVAQVGNSKYDSLAEAFAAANDGGTIALLENVAVSDETYTIKDGVSITLDMNGKKITVTDNKTSNYELFYIYGGMTVTGEGSIELTATNDRNWNAMSAIFHNRGGVLNIVNGTYKHFGGTDMAYVVDNSGNYYGDATANIKDGTLDSTYIAIRNRMEQNSHGASGKAILNVEGGTIIGVSRAIWAQASSTSETSPATGEINVSGGKIGLIDTPRSKGAVSMTTISGGEVAAFKGEIGELTVKGGTVDKVTMLSAAGEAVEYAVTEEGLYVTAFAQVGDNKYPTLQEAIDAAKDGKTVKVLADIELEKAITIAKVDKVTLDLNGKTISYESEVQGEAMITNKGELVINDSSEDKPGVINYDYKGAADPSYGKGNYTISNAGKLTINGGKITIASLSGHAKYPIDNNSTTGDAELIINGGHLYNYNTSAIRQFCNSTTHKNSVTINGGLIEGYCAVWVQNPGSNTVNGDLTIEGGEIRTTAKDYVNGTAELKDVRSSIYCTIAGNGGAWSSDSFVALNGGTFNENVNLAEAAPAKINVTGGEFKGAVYFEKSGIISGGTFITDVSAYLADGFVLEINMDDNNVITYGAIEEAEAAELEYAYTNTETGITYYSDSKEALAAALGVNVGNISINVLYLKQQIADLQEALAAAETSNAADKEALEKQIAELQGKLAAAESSNTANKEALEKQIAELQEALAAAESSNTADKEALKKQITGLEEALAAVKSLSAADKKALEDKIAELEKEIAELSEAEAKQLAAPVAKVSNVAKTGKIKVTWDAVEGADEYAVYRSTSEAGSYKRMHITTGTTYTNTNATAGKTYYYKVKALSDDKSVDNSELGNVVKRTCDLKRPVVTAKSTVKKQVKLTWKKVSGAKKYTVYRATSKNGKYKKIATTTKLSYTNKSLKAGKTYYYKVKAIAKKSAANSAFSVVDKCKVKK